MTSVRFDLEPHQWPPHAHGERLGFADAVFAVEWDAKEVEVAARLVQIGVESVLIFFRVLEGSQVYVVATSTGICLSPRWHHLISQEAKSDFLKQQLPKALKSDEFVSYGRLLPFRQSGQEPTNLYVAHDGTSGAWTTESSFAWTPFRLHDETDATPQSIANPDSPIGFALQWSRLSHQEQLRRSVVFENGDWNEFERVVRAVFVLDPSANSASGTQANFSGEFRFGISVPGGWRLPSERCRRWATYINGYFAPRRNPALAARHLCIAQQSLSPLIQLQLSPPTQHEHLEAALTLRDWAKGKIPDREARLLLPKF